jgi:hypothetical protein
MEPAIPSLWLRDFQIRPVKELLVTTTLKNNLPNTTIFTQTTTKTTSLAPNANFSMVQSPFARIVPFTTNLTTLLPSTLSNNSTTTTIRSSTLAKV